jgi:predicted nucleotidyltransferase
MPAHILIPQAALEALCQRYHVRRLTLFGSVLREDFGLASDVDMLVEFGVFGNYRGTPQHLVFY